MLYIVGTPIGNLSDVSQRVIDTLKSVSLIAAEDTRVTAKLLARFDIRKPLAAYHRHNERGMAETLARRMAEEGIDVALVSDAGMPGLSDPGAVLVHAAREAGVAVTCVPGPCAAITALALSGWSVGSFMFLGFPPREKSQLEKELARVGGICEAAVFYESPHRVQAFLEAVVAVPNARRALICNDLTKLFEWVYEGEPRDALAAFMDKGKANREKGEYCIAVLFGEPAQDERAGGQAGGGCVSPEALILERVMNGQGVNEATEAVRADGSHGISRNEAYRAAVRVKDFLELNTLR